MILRLEFPPTNLPSNDKKQILTEKYDDDYDDSDDLKLFSPCFLDLQICRTDRNPDL